jgi:hypothetical protein
MYPATLFGFRFAMAAGVIVAVIALACESQADRTPGPFSLPAFGITTAILSTTMFVCSLLLAGVSAWFLGGMERVKKSHPYWAGGAFALLTSALVYMLWSVTFAVMVPVLLVWIVTYPVLATALMWYVSRPNISLQRDRDR